MKNLTTLLLLAFVITTNAQKVGGVYMPAPTKDMPSWAQMLYQKNINVFELDKLYQKEKAAERQNGKIAQRSENGRELKDFEEGENVYEIYYKRWRRSIENYIQADGSIVYPEVSKQTGPVSNFIAPTAANSAWSLLGPTETFWKVTDNAAQPPAPWQVNIYSIGIAASNPNILYCGPETGGIFKSTDKGLNWTMVTKNYNIGSIDAMAVSPTDPNLVIAVRNGSIHRSTDGGTTWVSQSNSYGTPNCVKFKPDDPSKVFMSANNGLYTSVNGGLTWSVVPNMGVNRCIDVFFKPDDANTIYTLRKVNNVVQFWRSTDGGASFALSAGWNNADMTSDDGGRMTVSAADPNRIYIVVLGTAPITKPYIFKSTDAGATWTNTCQGITSGLTGDNSSPLGMSLGQWFYDLDIVADPNNADQVIVATTTAYRSTDGGNTFTRMGGYGGAFPIHPDIQEMTAIGNDTWICTDGGVNYSSDFFANTANHSGRTRGIHASEFWGFAQGWNEDITGGGRYHNGNTAMSEAFPAGQALRLGGGEAPTGDYMIGRPRHIAFSDISDVIVPTAKNQPEGSFTFNLYPNGDGYGSDASEIAFHPYCYNIVYCGKDSALWKSTDGGISWNTVFDFRAYAPLDGKVKKYEISRTNPDVIYLATTGGLYKTTNGGQNWIQLTLPAGTSMSRISISLSFTDENTVWITGPSFGSNNRVFKSTDGGSTWSNLSSATINSQGYSNILHQAGTNGGVYLLGSNGKVFYRNNSMGDWVAFNSQLPVIHNNLHIRPFYRDSKLRSAGNQGIWQVDFYEEGVPVAQPTVDKLSSSCARDTFYFEDYSALKHAGASWTWDFPGATYISDIHARNPKVVYGNAGVYDFTLSVTNAAGSSSKTIAQKISILSNACGADTIAGKALTLNNAGDYGQQTKPLNITTNTITMSCWIKPSGIQVGNAGIIFSGSGGATGLNFRNNNQLGYHWMNGSGSYNYGGAGTVPADQWSHVALVVTPDSATFYINGIPATRIAPHTAANFNSVFQLGIDRSNTTRNFKGQMDEVCIYNRALSRTEIRNLMNLTRNNPNAGGMPSVDNSLLCYYQFNESPALPCYDKVGINHIVLTGGANKTNLSTAPVGSGVSQTISVSTSGNYNFNVPGVEMGFPLAGTYPNGDLVVTRMNVPSDQLCMPIILPSQPQSYFIVRNYGSNSTFSALTKMKFSNVQGTTSAMVSAPANLSLFKRGTNDFGATWGTYNDKADIVTDNAGVGTVEFNTGLNITSFSQFEIGQDAALPMQLISFKANERNGTVTLQWKTANEVNLQGFEVQHSATQSNFNAIGFVAAGRTNYNFAHKTPVAGNNYYRLKIVDKNGAFTYSNIILVNLASSNQVVSISPNPSYNGWFTMSAQNNEAKSAAVSISSITGQLLQSFYLNNLTTTFNKNIGLRLPPGIYYMNISFDNGVMERKKLVIAQ